MRTLLLAALLLAPSLAWGQAGPLYANAPIADTNSAAFQGSVVVTPGTVATAGRSIGFICATAGTATFTFPDASTLTLTLVASPQLQTLPFAVTLVTAGTASCSWWNLK